MQLQFLVANLPPPLGQSLLCLRQTSIAIVERRFAVVERLLAPLDALLMAYLIEP